MMAEVRAVETFTGESNVFPWIRKVEMQCMVGELSESRTFAYACLLLDGPAAVWLDTVTVSTWAELKLRMCERFGESMEGLLTRLRTLKQDSRTVGRYTDTFNGILAQLQQHGQYLPRVMTLNFYLTGLRPNLRTKVVNSHPRTIEAAYAEALYFEGDTSSASAQFKWGDVSGKHFASNLMVGKSCTERSESSRWQITERRLHSKLQRLQEFIARREVWGFQQLFEECESDLAALKGQYADFDSTAEDSKCMHFGRPRPVHPYDKQAFDDCDQSRSDYDAWNDPDNDFDQGDCFSDHSEDTESASG